MVSWGISQAPKKTKSNIMSQIWLINDSSEHVVYHLAKMLDKAFSLAVVHGGAVVVDLEEPRESARR